MREKLISHTEEQSPEMTGAMSGETLIDTLTRLKKQLMVHRNDDQAIKRVNDELDQLQIITTPISDREHIWVMGQITLVRSQTERPLMGRIWHLITHAGTWLSKERTVENISIASAKISPLTVGVSRETATAINEDQISGVLPALSAIIQNIDNYMRETGNTPAVFTKPNGV